MSVQPVRLYVDPILHKPCELITDFTTLDNIVSDMVETMLEYRGVGLSANQVGVNKNLAVLYIENKTKIIVVTNIKILRYNKEANILNEGCLSCPGITIPIRRYTEVEIEAQRLNGETFTLKLNDFDARILQHEYDHLCGKLIINNLVKL
ncbi:MAG: peptide deformylase [bacterium]